MKKIICVLGLILGMTLITLSGCHNKDKNLEKVRVNEVTRSIFYAPQYVALEKGYFEDEGLEIELQTGFGADKSMTAILSGNADIGFMGSEASIYIYNEGQEDYVVNFALLTQRAGNFLVAREATDSFSWEDVKGKVIIGGRKGGMPQMVLEYILKKNSIDPEKDVEIITNIDFANTAGAFAGGTGDYSVEFEPAASSLENAGTGKIVASLGIDSGLVPYTGYMARKSYIEQNEETIQKFTNAIYKGQLFVQKHSAEEIAKVILPYFKDSDLATVTQIVERYKSQDSWTPDPVFAEERLTLLQNILNEAGELKAWVPYENLVNTKYAYKVLE